MVALALSACLDAPPGATVEPGEDGGALACTWLDPEVLDSPTSIGGPTVDRTETMLVGEESDLRLYERDTVGDGFGNVGGIVDSLNTPDVEASPSLSPDGNDLYFTRGDRDFLADVWVAHRGSSADPFGPAQMVVGLSDPDISESGVAVWDAGGRHEIFYARRVDGGQADIARAVCSSRTVCEPSGSYPGIDSDADEVTPTISGDGLDLYFVRYGEGIFFAHRLGPDSDFEIADERPVLGTAGDVSYLDPEVSEDGETMYVVVYEVSSDTYTIRVSHRTCE